MKKFLFLFLSCIIGISSYSQDDFPFDFVPVEGQIYYLKCQSDSRGLRTAFLADLGGDTITRADMSPEDAVANGSAAGWLVTLDADKGYTIQNAATNKYMKFVGSYESSVVTDYRARDMIIPEDWNSSEEERYYFSITIYRDRAPYSLNAGSLSFEIQGYNIVAIDSPEDQALDAYDTGMGTYTISTGNQNYQSWFFMTKEDVEAFYIVLEESYFSFRPEDGQAYYIKTLGVGRDTKFVVQVETGDTLSHKSYEELDVTTDDYAKWYFTYIVEKKGYHIQNKATGDYFKYTGIPNSRDAILMTPLVEEDPNYEEEDFIFPIVDDPARLVIGMEKFSSQVPTYAAQPYRILDFSRSQALDAWGNGVSIGTYGQENKSNHSWLFMTDQDLENFKAAIAYEPELMFLSDDPNQVYTIRPNTLWVKWSDQESKDRFNTEEEFEAAKNARLIGIGGEMLELDMYDLDNDLEHWNIIRATDTTFIFKNIGTKLHFGNADVLTLNKYADPGVTIEIEHALPYAYIGDEDPDDLAQFLSIEFAGWVEDEYGKLAQAVGIGNKHIYAPEDVDPNNASRASTPFYLDYWNNGRSFAYDLVAVFTRWYTSSGDLAPAQQWIIRKIEDDQPGGNTSTDNVTQEPSARVYSSQGNIVVVLPEGVTEANIRVYTVNGALVQSTNKTTIPAAQGFYVVKVGTEAHKVIVK